jgi:hypothetical protein
LASSNTNPSTNHLPALTVAVFFGRNILTTMAVLMQLQMQSQDEFHFDPVDKILNYSELVITGLAMSSIFFIVATMGIIPAAVGRILKITRFVTFAHNRMFIGFCLLCGIFVLMLLPFSYRSNSSSSYLGYSLHVIHIFFMTENK